MCERAASHLHPRSLNTCLHKSAEWAAVTSHQVRRISTACKKLEPQLDAAAKAAKQKVDEKARGQHSVIALDARIQQGRRRRSNGSRFSSLLLDTFMTWIRGSLRGSCCVTIGILVYSSESSAVAYLQPAPPTSSAQSEPRLLGVDLSRGFGSYSSWSAGLEFLAKQVSDHQAVAVCLVVKSSAIQHPPLPSCIQEQDGIIIQLEAPGISKLEFTPSSDADAEETFDVDFNELDLLPAFFDSWCCDVAGPRCVRSSPDECSIVLPLWQCELCDFAACATCCSTQLQSAPVVIC